MPHREQSDPAALSAIRANLQHLRKQAGFKTQEDFAAALGMGATYARDTVGSWERGQRNFSVSSLARICRLLNVSADQLLDLPPRPTPGFCVIRKDYLETLKRKLLAAVDAIDAVQEKSDSSRSAPSSTTRSESAS